MNRVALFALSMTLVAPAAMAEPNASWAASFPAERVAEYIESPPPRMIVIPAGDVDAGPAAEALRDALRRSNKTALVMSHAPLGKVTDLDDESIVRKAAHLPVERIAIVRAFAGGKGDKNSAVVTVYDKKAATVVAFTAEQGVALSGRGASEGLSPGAAGAVHEVLRQEKQDKDEPPQSSPAEEQWQRKAVWFQDWAGINQYGAVVSTWSIPLRGIQHERLDGGRFYDAIDRPDLARRYRHKRGVRMGLAFTGLGALVGGLGTMGWALAEMLAANHIAEPSMQNGTTYQYPSGSSATLAWGVTGGLMGGGLVLMIAGLCVNPNPVSADEARQMAIDYDIGLRKKLGLPPLTADNESPSRLRRASGLVVTPMFGPQGGGVSASFRF